MLQAIAAENNLAETAFLVPKGARLSSALVHADYRSTTLRPRYVGQCSGRHGAARARAQDSGVSTRPAAPSL